MFNKLILGTVQMGMPYGIGNSDGQISETESINILNFAYKNGIRLLDTAEAYGTAHNVIGKYHRLFSESEFKVITKLPHVIDENIALKIDHYLSDLRIKSLHALLFHSFESYKNNKHQLNILKQFKSAKKIELIGVSAYTNEEVEEIIEDKNIDIIQLPYNVFDNFNLRNKILQKAKDKGKILHTRSCFLQGLFFMPLNSNKLIVKKLKNELDILHSISERHQISLPRIALNYCLQQKLINSVLIGVDSVHQLKQNLDDANFILSSNIVEEINSIHIKNKDLLNPSLWNLL